MARQYCDECRFYFHPRLEEDLQDDIPLIPGVEFKGDCRRFPPRIIVLQDNEIEHSFPQVETYDSCGEWKPTLDSGSISVYDDE